MGVLAALQTWVSLTVVATPRTSRWQAHDTKSMQDEKKRRYMQEWCSGNPDN